MIKCFLSDSVVIDRSDPTTDNKLSSTNCCVLDDQHMSYFRFPMTITDNRASRLAIDYRATTYLNTADPNDTGYIPITGTTGAGNNTLIQSPDISVAYGVYTEGADETAFGTETLPTTPVSISNSQMELVFDRLKASPTELSMVDGITDAVRADLMDIVEYIVYGTILTDTPATINTALTTFASYVPGSVATSMYRTSMPIYGGINVHRFVPRWISFSIVIDTTEVSFRVWVDRNDFRYLFPDYSVLKVIPPFELSILVNPDSISDPFEAANLSAVTMSNELAINITSENITSYVAMTTRYIVGSNVRQVTFGVLINGRHPSIFETRSIIASHLLNSGIGDSTIWQTRLPDLFVSNQFMMVPMWDNSNVHASNTIYPSIISNTTQDANMLTLMSNIVVDTQLYENITVAYDKFFIGTLPGTGNVHSSIGDIHPTYQDFSSTEPEFAYMAQGTQEFAIQLNNVLAIASGEINNTTYGVISLDGKDFLSMVHDGTEYLIMTKASYLANI